MLLQDKTFINDFTPRSYNWDEINKEKAIRMMDWQKEAFKYKNEQYLLIHAPCGSGKTAMQIWLAVHDVMANRFKQLIITPQSHIGMEFSCLDVWYNGRIVNWCPAENFCVKDSFKSMQRLRNFLLTDSSLLARNFDKKEVSTLACITTHNALARVWEQFTDKERKRALHNLAVTIDEAHHVKLASADEDFEGFSAIQIATLKDISTILGDICAYAMNNKTNCKIRLATATFSRGDCHFILSKNLMNRFKSYHLSLVDYWKTTGIKEVQITYNRYQDNPIKLMCQNINSELDKYHLVILPKQGDRFRKESTSQEIISQLKISKDAILDLVTQSAQEKNKELLRNSFVEKHRDFNPSRFKVVISCALFNEGTNWRPCDRIHNTACEKSVTLAVQRFGRCLRPYDKKTEVKVLYYVMQDTNNENLRVRYSEHILGISLSMIIHDLFEPIMLPTLNQMKTKTPNPRESYVTLDDVFGHEFQSVMGQILEATELIGPSSKNLDFVVTETVKAFVDANQLGEEFDVKEVVLAVKKHIARHFLPKEVLKTMPADLSELRESFDQIWPLAENNYSICGGELTTEKMDELKDILYSKKILRELAADQKLSEVQSNPDIENISDAVERLKAKRLASRMATTA